MTTTVTDPDIIARAYIDAVGAHDLDSLDTLFDDSLDAAFAGGHFDKGEWIAALRRLLPVLVRNDIRETFVAGPRVCITYDFVTDTSAGAVACIELITVDRGRITSIELLLDRVAFAPVGVALEARRV
jgi:hypothetical protein